MRLKPSEIFLLLVIYILSVAIRLLPKLAFDPHLLTFDADIWYRLCLAQYVLDNGHLPVWDIRYASYGQVPFWYNPFAVYFYALMSKISTFDLPTVASRIMPLVESAAILPFYFLGRYLYSVRVAAVSTVFLALTPAFVYWSSLGTPQSFTMFCIPLAILLWVTFLQNKFILNHKYIHFLVFVILLTVNFLTHLTYFNLVVILLFVHVSLLNEKVGSFKKTGLLAAAVLISQVLTSWWWLPGNLYWWWTKGLSTSTASPDRILLMRHYGSVSAVIGHLAFFFLVYFIFRRKHKKEMFYLLPVYWAIYPIIESHMEGMLLLFQKNALMWNNLVRPIEGFRFYSFLAQPLALCFALMFEQMLKSKFVKIQATQLNRLCCGVMVILVLLLGADLYFGYKINDRFRSHMITLDDVEAAQWIRHNTGEETRVLADYYTAQMVGGICAGRALQGSMFPLKGANIPYISDSWQVLNDIYKVYKSEDPLAVKAVLQRYHVTHVYYSDLVLRKMEFVVNGYGDMDGYEKGRFDGLKKVDHQKTLLNPDYFQVVYSKNGVKILAVK